MNPTLSAAVHPGPSTCATGTDLRSQVVEQVMRACDDDLAVLPFLDVEPGGSAAAAVLGRFLTESPLRLVSGCPLIALVTRSPVDPHWREAYPARAESLYAHLEFLTSLYGPVPDADAYTALETLRSRELDDLGPLA